MRPYILKIYKAILKDLWKASSYKRGKGINITLSDQKTESKVYIKIRAE